MSKPSSSFHGILALLFTASFSLLVSSVNPLPHLNAGTTASRSEESTSILIREKPECDFDCRGSERSYYCASNGRTIDSKCKVDRAQCYDRMLEVTAGKCQDSKRCEQERSYGLRLQSKPSRLVHVPTCKNDGTYAQVQCDMYIGYCWCVTSLGHMIRNSTVKIGTMPPCSKSKSSKKSRCKSEAEKVTFAMKLRTYIVQEYKRKSPSSSDGRYGLTEHKAVTWKLDKMDRSNDGYLSTREVNKLLRQYKRQLSRPCTKVFMKYCDANSDRKVTASEWKTCLGTPTPRVPRQKGRFVKSVTTGPPAPDNVLIGSHERINDITSGPSPSGGTNLKPGTAPQAPQTCRDVRDAILKHKKKDVMVPMCEGENMEYWAPVQCHKGAGYCYCALRENGHPISQTAVTHGKPDCNMLTSSSMISVPIPGCPPKIKARFLRDIQNVLIDKMVKALGGQVLEDSDTNQSLKERAARWYFDVADENHDRVLTRRENKKFKKLLSAHRLPKKCMRKFTQHCDRNHNKKTTKDELVACLEVRQQERIPRRPGISESIKQLKTTDDPDNF